MNKTTLFFCIFFFLLSCKEETIVPTPSDDDLSPTSKILLEKLQNEIQSLSENPLDWTDVQLSFLDKFKDTPILGLGEATHGSGNIFQTKFRIFRYMVENHGFKVFSFEADFAESLYLENAIQESKTSEIRDIMYDKMHFWTWKTEEVLQLLEWMSEYNKSKSDNDKIHYVGNDCQFLDYQADFVNPYLMKTNATFQAELSQTINFLQETATNKYTDFSKSELINYLDTLDQILVLFDKEKPDLISKSSENEYGIVRQVIINIGQAFETNFYRYNNNNEGINHRDKYMADNTIWANEHFNEKTILWAHNFHACVWLQPNFATQGKYIKNIIGQNYQNIGFVFSKGWLRAAGKRGDTFLGLDAYKIEKDPKKNSMIEVFFKTEEDAFYLDMSSLNKYPEWNKAFENGIQYFQIGSVYQTDKPYAYYAPYEKGFFNGLIYFKNSTASSPLK